MTRLATQFNMTTIESWGFWVADSFRNLTMINEAIQLIKENHGRNDFSKMDYDDPAVYEMISKGVRRGISSLKVRAQTEFMKNLNPSCFEDIVAEFRFIDRVRWTRFQSI